MMKNRRRLALLAIFGVWLAFSGYFAYLHTFTIKTFYLDEKIDLGDRQFIVQELDAYNFVRDFTDFSDHWWINVVNRLPVSLQLPFYKVVNFYSQPRITYNDTWEVDVKGIAIPRLPEQSTGYLSIFIDGHLSGQGFHQSSNDDYTFFNSQGDYFSAADVDQPLNLILEDKISGQKTALKIDPQWTKKYYFMSLPSEMGNNPADTVRQFLALVSQGKKSEALNLVTAEKRNGITWPPSTQILNQMSTEDNLSYSLERRENQGEYPVIYSLTVRGTEETVPLTVNMIKNQDYYEIINIR